MWEKIEASQLGENFFELIGKKWMLVTAGTENSLNTMTASWGGLGMLWNAPMATIYIRPQRYTKQFIDQQEYFSLSFFPDDQRENLALCGAKSGRDIDKVSACGFTVCTGAAQTPYFDQANLVLICRKRYQAPLDAQALPNDVKEKFYPEKDYHTVYFGEIVEVLVKE